jgi:hypothetical protein
MIVQKSKNISIAFCSPMAVNYFPVFFERGKYGAIVFYQGGMAGSTGNGGQARRGRVQRDLDVDDAGTAVGTTILSGGPRGSAAGKMAHGKKSENLYKDGGKARSGEDGAGE